MIHWSRCSHCSFWLKYGLFAINFLVSVGGLIAIIIGICALVDNKHSGLMSQLPILPALLLTAVGAVGFSVGFIGLLGALRESFCLLKMFCVAASVLFLCEIIGGVLMFALLGHVHSVISSHIKQAIVNYQTDERLQEFIDYIQRKLECCGSSDYRDWDDNSHFSCTVSMSSKLHCSVPLSCCAVRGDVYCGLRVRPTGELPMESSVYSHGCTLLLLNVFKSSIIYISIFAFAIGISEVVGVVLANALMHSIIRSSTSQLDECDTFELNVTQTASDVDDGKDELS